MTTATLEVKKQKSHGGSTKVRLRMDVKLYDCDHNLVLSTTKMVPKGITAWLQGLQDKKWTVGTMRVWYNRRNGFWNEFEFSSVEDYKEKASPCFDGDLIKSFV